jgi:hypothetical protein
LKELDPASDRAQALLRRGTGLIEAFTGRDPGISANIQALYRDRANWPANAKHGG